MVNSSTLDGISTHSAREDGDVIGWEIIRATMVISTHSAREDGDALKPKRCIALAYFNPLRPRGRRRMQCHRAPLQKGISTHSAREDGD